MHTFLVKYLNYSMVTNFRHHKVEITIKCYFPSIFSGRRHDTFQAIFKRQRHVLFCVYSCREAGMKSSFRRPILVVSSRGEGWSHDNWPIDVSSCLRPEGLCVTYELSASLFNNFTDKSWCYNHVFSTWFWSNLVEYPMLDSNFVLDDHREIFQRHFQFFPPT